MLPTEKAGARWIRTRKMASRPRGKEPPAGPWTVREAVHISEGRRASEAQSPGKGPVKQGMGSVRGNQEEDVESWDQLG